MKDLHIHTKYSDGEYDEFEIIKRVVEAGITEFSICDHDTIEGSQKISNILKKENTNLKFHSGAEITSRVSEIFGGVNVHLLVRDFDYDEDGINCLISEISTLRAKKVQRMVDFIKKVYNIEFSEKEIEDVKKSTNSVGKPHFYKLLCKYGNFNREEYYKNMDNLHSEDLRLDALRVLKFVNMGRGNVSLAHPVEIMQEYNLSYKQIDVIVGYLASFGLKGLETHHSKQTKEDIEQFSKIASKYNLFETFGSDFHGENIKPDVRLGVCEK